MEFSYFGWLSFIVPDFPRVLDSTPNASMHCAVVRDFVVNQSLLVAANSSKIGWDVPSMRPACVTIIKRSVVVFEFMGEGVDLDLSDFENPIKNDPSYSLLAAWSSQRAMVCKIS